MMQFKDEYEWLSNFSDCEIEYEGIKYPSVEHFYVAMKTTDPKIRSEISELPTSGKAKRFGRKLEKEGMVRPEWEDLKVSIMKFALDEKYSQEPYKSLLIETGDIEIQEGNMWGDTFWGIDLESGEGRNTLGKMIMKIRKKLRKEQF